MTQHSDEVVLQACDWLERDYEAGGLTVANQFWREIYHLNEVPRLADELTRGRTITNPTPRLASWSENLGNQLISYKTFPVLTPVGDALTPTEVDKLEGMLAVILAKLNEGQKLATRAYRGFALRSHVVYQLKEGDPDDQIPFSVELPNINTTFFERFEGGTPPQLSRRYDMLVKDVVARYSNNKRTPGGKGYGPKWDANRKRISGWEPLSGEYVMGSTSFTTQDGFAQRVHIRELYDSTGCYHLLCSGNWDDKQAEKQLLWYQENPSGKVPFAVIPSTDQEHDEWKEAWKPKGWPGYSLVLQINRIEAIRATRAEHIQDHIIQRMTPDQYEAVMKLKGAGYAPVLHGGVNFVQLPAEEIKLWTQIPDADLKERAAERRDELEKWIASYLFPATEQTISQSNVGSAQIGLAVVHQNEAGFISSHAWGMGLMAEQIVAGLGTSYLGNRTFASKDEVSYGREGAKKLTPGKQISVPAATLRRVQVYGADANVRIEVVTRSETESELEQYEAGVWNNVQRGSQTFDEYIAVRNPDVEGAHARLAKDKTLKAAAATFDATIPYVGANRLLLRYGVNVSSLIPGAAAPAGSAPSGGPGGGSTTVTQAMPTTGGQEVSSLGGPGPAGGTA